MQRNVKKCRDILVAFMTFMTHGNVIFDILEPPSFKKKAHVGSCNLILKNLIEF